ncbi:hypothetical protein G6F61_014542 [Rhizopus arrhizus]|nr:hypothetical protein G6F61_014542 [Rhizopus arrhizus]
MFDRQPKSRCGGADTGNGRSASSAAVAAAPQAQPILPATRARVLLRSSTSTPPNSLAEVSIAAWLIAYSPCIARHRLCSSVRIGCIASAHSAGSGWSAGSSTSMSASSCALAWTRLAPTMLSTR